MMGKKVMFALRTEVECVGRWSGMANGVGTFARNSGVLGIEEAAWLRACVFSVFRF